MLGRLRRHETGHAAGRAGVPEDPVLRAAVGTGAVMGGGGLQAEDFFKDGEYGRIVAALFRRGAGQGAKGDDCAAALPELLHLGQGSRSAPS